MAVRYVPIDGEHVSAPWFALLHDIRHEDHVDFNVNEGHRTMRRQAYLKAHPPRDANGRPVLVAWPSPFAPHIRTGRVDHAVDFRNAEGVQNAAARRGVTLRRTVVGEEWHLEADKAELLAYYRRHLHHGPRTLRPGCKPGADVKRAQVLLRALRFLPSTHRARRGYGEATQDAVRRFKRKHGLDDTPVLGPHAWKALEHAYDNHRR